MYVQSITAAVDKDYLEFDESLKELKNQNMTTFDFEENIPCSFAMCLEVFKLRLGPNQHSPCRSSICLSTDF